MVSSHLSSTQKVHRTQVFMEEVQSSFITQPNLSNRLLLGAQGEPSCQAQSKLRVKPLTTWYHAISKSLKQKEMPSPPSQQPPPSVPFPRWNHTLVQVQVDQHRGGDHLTAEGVLIKRHWQFYGP